MEKVHRVSFFFFKAFGRVSDEQVVARFCRYFLDARQYGSDEVTVELVYDNADGIRFLLAQVARKIVVPVTHFFRLTENALRG